MTWWQEFSSKPYAPNALSFLRGVIGLFLPFLLFKPGFYPLLAFILFWFGVATDYWDGALARRHQHVSDSGKIIDPSMDKILILGPMCAFGWHGYYSLWWVVPIVLREAVVTFCRVGWSLEGKAIGAEKLGKYKFGIQVAAVAAAFFTLLFNQVHWTAVAGFFGFLMHSLLIVACAMTVISGVTFFRSNSNLFHTPGFARYTAAFGVGLLPGPSGTWGTALTVVIAFLCSWSPWLYFFVFLACGAAGYWAVSHLDLSAEKDPHYVVVDEVLGTLITFAGFALNAKIMVAGFFFFRFFDIVKPFPLRRLERLPGYWGIVLDDVGAGIYSWLLLAFIFR